MNVFHWAKYEIPSAYAHCCCQMIIRLLPHTAQKIKNGGRQKDCFRHLLYYSIETDSIICRLLVLVLVDLYEKSLKDVGIFFFLAGLLQPPVRIVSQPQPARRLDPPPRFSGRNERGDPMANRKDDRRCDINFHSTLYTLERLNT